MSEIISEQLSEAIIGMLQKNALLAGDGWRCEVLSGDGSDRRFVRIVQEQAPAYLVALPNQNHPQGMAEALSSYQIGKHLYDRGVPVPKIFWFDEQTGIIVFEDLGNVLLHDYIINYSVPASGTNPTGPADVVLKYYEEAIRELIKLQLSGSKGFSAEYCWDTAKYDEQLMQEKESNYFRQAFCEDFLGFTNFPDSLTEEFRQLAHRAAQEPAGYLLHRDFQSRNLMVHNDRIRIIDFQGARFGPLGYDLASLLIDPYAGLSGEQQDKLRDYYLTILEQRISVDRDRFIEGYYYMALQRNLQILGAFAFLSQRKGKVFFRDYIRPAAGSLYAHLAKPAGKTFPVLRGLADNILSRLKDNPEPVHK